MSPDLCPALVRAAAAIAGGLFIGGVVGIWYFGVLWRSTRAMVDGRSMVRVAVFQLLRLVVTGGALVLAVTCGGTLSLLAATAAIIGARAVVLRRSGTGP